MRSMHSAHADRKLHVGNGVVGVLLVLLHVAKSAAPSVNFPTEKYNIAVVVVKTADKKMRKRKHNLGVKSMLDGSHWC